MDGAGRITSKVALSYATLFACLLYQFQSFMTFVQTAPVVDDPQSLLIRNIFYLLAYVLSIIAFYYKLYRKDSHSRNLFKAVLATSIMLSNAALLHFTVVPENIIQIRAAEIYSTLLSVPISWLCSLLFFHEILYQNIPAIRVDSENEAEKVIIH
ncbi:hypothetical protein M422DRAFT_72046 [Sphaerobolus stellatus SS14]|uniref:Unplaced genomic scaffold SPHSTscaffold_324, whole genome shotgun sequence n=1 Tax=Sphaerobolus stellatus (strain SS14) TaxID=990650 RepID=A0A0C9UK54_SPHS4|nr:hypothetical protein M422DRAFT_72046 [Sphaerobolus stellatus SS14]